MFCHSGVTSQTSVSLHLGKKEMVILGTQYAGEMKKGILTLMMYLMPKMGQLPLHSSCNVGPEGDVTLFFGLSGTGKTTLVGYRSIYARFRRCMLWYSVFALVWR